MTAAGGELYLVNETKKRRIQIVAFDAETFARQRDIIIADVHSPRSVTACERYNCLYIGDVELQCIHRVDLSTSQVRVVPLWNVPPELQFSLSR